MNSEVDSGPFPIEEVCKLRKFFDEKFFFPIKCRFLYSLDVVSDLNKRALRGTREVYFKKKLNSFSP